jgi:hypothetical protein
MSWCPLTVIWGEKEKYEFERYKKACIYTEWISNAYEFFATELKKYILKYHVLIFIQGWKYSATTM